MKDLLKAILLSAFTLTSLPVAVKDLAQLGKKDSWSTIEKARVKSYLEPAGWVGSALPSVGITSGMHHAAILGDAYIDKDLPGNSTMKFLRKVVMNSPGNGKKCGDFKCRLQKHEDIALQRFKSSGSKTYVSNIVQPVPFYSYGLPFKDHFAVQIRTDIVNEEPKTSFAVWGLGIIVDSRNPETFGPQFDWLASPFGLQGEDLINWTTKVEKNGIAKPFWIFITESDETSYFSHEAVKKSASTRKSEWNSKTKEIHYSGKGKSVKELYRFF